MPQVGEVNMARDAPRGSAGRGWLVERPLEADETAADRVEQVGHPLGPVWSGFGWEGDEELLRG